MTLKLVGQEEPEFETCPRCNGRGRIPCPPRINTRTGVGGKMLIGGEWVPVLTPGTGHPIPCPTCNGKKVTPIRKES